MERTPLPLVGTMNVARKPPENGRVMGYPRGHAKEQINLRVAHESYIAWRRAAFYLKLSFSEWARRVMDTAANDTLDAADAEDDDVSPN